MQRVCAGRAGQLDGRGGPRNLRHPRGTLRTDWGRPDVRRPRRPAGRSRRTRRRSPRRCWRRTPTWSSCRCDAPRCGPMQHIHLQHAANATQPVAIRCNTPAHAATRCDLLRHAASDTFQRAATQSCRKATCCHALQHVETRCNTPLRGATRHCARVRCSATRFAAPADVGCFRSARRPR